MMPVTRADIVLILLLLMGLPLLYWHFWTTGEGTQLRLMVQGQQPRLLPLTDQTLRVTGSLGETLIEIDGGRVRFHSAPCQNKVCIRRGWIHHAGELVACLPNRVSIQILGGNPRYDAINF